MAQNRGQVTLDENVTITKRLQTVTRTDGSTSDTIHNEVFCLIDSDSGSDLSTARILNTTPAGTEFALLTRNIPSGTQTVSGTITVSDTASTPLFVQQTDGTTAQTWAVIDTDTGAPTVNRIAVGLIVPASGGAVAIGGSVANGLQVDVTRVQGTVTVSGTVTVTAAVGSPAFVELSDGAAALKGQKTMANSLPVTLASDQSTIIVDTRRGQTPKFAIINASASGNNTIVAAGTNKIKVISYVMVAAGTVNVTWQSGASGTALSGAIPLVANSGVALSAGSGPHLFETAAATLLNMSLNAAVAVTGHLTYIDEA